MTRRTKRRIQQLVTHVLLISFIALICLPFGIVIAASFQAGNLAPRILWPDNFSLDHWKYVLGIPYEELVNRETGVTRMVQAPVVPLIWFWNSLKVAVLSSAGIVLLSGTAAYAFARLRFFGKGPILSALLILQMFPLVLALIAYRTILETVGEVAPAFGLNSHWGLIAVYLGGISIFIWMIKGYFDTIPKSMEESGRVDGASPFQTFAHILLPMSLPIFAVVFILSFITVMSEFPVAAVLMQTGEQYTLAVGANSFLYEQEKLWGRFSALAVLSGIPITLVFIFSQRFLVSGLTSGGVKG